WTYGFIKPTLKYQYTQYQLDLDSIGKNQIAAPTCSDLSSYLLARVTPVQSVAIILCRSFP
ncbi:hypothetical protein, partial [Pseudomonas sp. NPDC086278]|uniref:hypothetical protein n=1 Tax=Pseudomonas sp. NPDC086278 TaxID=3390646 RepID=UPI003CFCE8BE